jgi:hypothetical protein
MPPDSPELVLWLCREGTIPFPDQPSPGPAGGEFHEHGECSRTTESGLPGP